MTGGQAPVRRWTGKLALSIILIAMLLATFTGLVWVRIIAITFLALPLAAAVHEAGHLLAAALVGFKITAVGVGCRRIRTGLRIAGVCLFLASEGFPRAFTIVDSAADRNSRPRVVLFFLGGPLSNLIIAILGLLTARPGSVVFGLGLANALFLLMNLLPHLFVGEQGRRLSDIARALSFLGRDPPAPADGGDDTAMLLQELVAAGLMNDRQA